MAARGFSLLEVAVASAMAGIIGAAAIGSFAVLNRQLTRLQAEASVSDDAKTLVDFLVTRMQAVGGDQVRPWMALHVEDGGLAASDARCANFNQNPCGDSDRVTLGTLVPDSTTCEVTAMTPTTITSTGVGANCCWAALFQTAGFDMRAAPVGLPAENEVGLHVVLVRGNNNRQVSLSNLDSTTCTMNWAPGPLAAVDVNPASPFVGGTASGVTIETIFLDEGEHKLLSFVEKRGFNGTNITMDADERQTLANNVFDFQVQLGYDGDPADGRLVDDGTTTDEWLYNAANDTLPREISADDLRMVGLGVILGVNVGDSGYVSQAQIVGGAPITVTGSHIRGAMGRAALRNVFVFF